MSDITVDVALYGPVARCVGKKHLAQMTVQIKDGTTLGGLLQRWAIEKDDTGFIFINAVLCDVPGMNVSHDLVLQDGDHVLSDVVISLPKGSESVNDFEFDYLDGQDAEGFNRVRDEEQILFLALGLLIDDIELRQMDIEDRLELKTNSKILKKLEDEKLIKRHGNKRKEITDYGLEWHKLQSKMRDISTIRELMEPCHS